MTGTGSGNTPVIYTNGVDSNINMAFMPKGTGGVGIGTTSPTASALQTTSTSTFNPTSMALNSAAIGNLSANGCTGGALVMANPTGGATDQGFISYSGSSVHLGQLQSGNCYQILDLDNNGNVGIWNTSPGALLDLGLAGTTTRQSAA